MHASERSQEGAQPRACPFTRVAQERPSISRDDGSSCRTDVRSGAWAVAVNFPHAIPIIVTRPLVLPMIDRGMWQIQSMVTAILVRIDDCCIPRDSFAQNTLTGGLITMADHPTALFPSLTTDDMNDRRPVIVIGAMPGLLHPEGTRPADAADRQADNGAYFFSPAFW
jgi:hypothetical protein